MRNVVAISLPDNLLNKLSAECKEENTSRSEIIRMSLKRYFFAKDFTRLREKSLIELAKKGLTYTEQQIFDQVS